MSAPPTPTAAEPGAADGFAGLTDLPAAARVEILHAFRQRSTDDMAGLIDALTTGAATDARFLAHRLHGASATLGATTLARLCAAIETDPAAADPLDAVRTADRIAALRAEFAAVMGRIEAAERGHTPS